MKLDDFLKCTKVRYINLDGKGLTNKEYELLGVTDRSCIINDNGCEIWVDINNCEPVLDQLEPFQMMKVVVTATSFDNWFSLRLHPDAQPEIHELAKAMYEAIQNSIPFELSYGEWHLPYIERQRDEEGEIKYFVYNTDEDPTSEAFGYQYITPLTLEQAQKISCSCCAQVSYRKSDTSIAKSEVIYDKLVNSKPVHASAFEHCAAPIDIELRHNREFPKGITGIALDRTQPNNIATYLSGNFTNWIQYRQLIKDHDCKEFKKELNT